MYCKRKIGNLFFIFTVFFLQSEPATCYTNLTVEEVHNRLTNADTLLLLDVREVNEYRDGHIAEPMGQLPLTPINMALNSNVLSKEYSRLPKDIDIVVYCRSGARSASASSFLESKGFTRIFNMLGGFSSWIHESRNEGYGDHTGQWIYATDLNSTIINYSSGVDTSKIIISPVALPEFDESIYVELHFASSKFPIPPNVPMSSIDALYRLTVLDQFGLSKFNGDSLVLADQVTIRLFPEYETDKNALNIKNHDMTYYVPGYGWQSVSYNFENHAFNRQEMTLRRWYNVELHASSNVTLTRQMEIQDVKVFPNPFNSIIHVSVPTDASIYVYDVKGRIVEQIETGKWIPDKNLVSGVYFISIYYSNKVQSKKVTFLK